MNSKRVVVMTQTAALQNKNDHSEMVSKILYDFIVLKDIYLTYKNLSEFIQRETYSKQKEFIHSYISTVSTIFIKQVMEGKIKRCILNNTLLISYDSAKNWQVISADNNLSQNLLKKIDFKCHKFLYYHFVDKLINTFDNRVYTGIRQYTDPVDFLYYALPDDDTILDLFESLYEGGYSNTSSVFYDVIISMKQMFKEDEFHTFLFILMEFSANILNNFVNEKTDEMVAATCRNPIFGLFHGLFFVIEDLYYKKDLNFKVLDTCCKLTDNIPFVTGYRKARIHQFMTNMSKLMFLDRRRKEEHYKKQSEKMKKKVDTNVINFTKRIGEKQKQNYDNHQKMIQEIIAAM